MTYTDRDGNTYSVALIATCQYGVKYGTVKQYAGYHLERVERCFLPLRDTPEQAKTDLAIYAKWRGWQEETNEAD